MSSANTTKVCLVQFFKQANKRYYISTIDNDIKFLCACFVIRDATPRILPREKRRSEDSRGGIGSVFPAPKTKAKVNRSRRDSGYDTIDRLALFIRGGSNISNEITDALLLRQIRWIFLVRPPRYPRCDTVFLPPSNHLREAIVARFFSITPHHIFFHGKLNNTVLSFVHRVKTQLTIS